MSTIIKLTEEEIAAEQQRFIVKVYAWMSAALIITGIVAFWASITPEVVQIIFGTRFVFMALIMAELVLVGSLVGFVQKLSAQLAILIFAFYSILNGLTLSVIFLAYTSESIATTFFVTAGTFGVMSAYGYFTKSDLMKTGNILIMGLVGIVLASIVNIFLKSEMMYWIITYVGIFIFVGLIAYDTQKIKNLNVIGNEGTDEDKKEAIIGALTLYLDFINLFLLLLRIFGRRK